MEDVSIKLRLLHASYYAHIKGAEEMARIGAYERAEEMRNESNLISEKIHQIKNEMGLSNKD